MILASPSVLLAKDLSHDSASGQCTPKNSPVSSQSNALFQAISSDVVPEIMKLPKGAAIPKSVIEKEDSRKIARTLVARVRKEQDGNGKGGYDFLKNAEIHLAFRDSLFPSIRDNCFLNQHQTGTSKGRFNPKVRAEIEDDFTPLKIEAEYNADPKNPAHKIRPKYAFLGLDKPSSKVKSEYEKTYGNVFAVMKPEVKTRTTFNENDTMGKGIHVKTLYRKGPVDTSYGYMEAQVWGELCLSDVQSFLVNCPFTEPVSSQSLEQMKASGIPIYECAGNTSGIKAGRQLSPENPSLRKALK